MKKINKIAIAGLSLALLTNVSVFAEAKSIIKDNNIVSQSILRSSNLDYKNLSDGIYNIDLKVTKAARKQKNELSMMNDAVEDKKIVVRNGKYFLQLKLRGITVYGQNGYLNWLKYSDENGNYKDSKILSTMKIDGIEYPRELEFPITKPNENNQKIKVKVYSDAMNTYTGGNGIKIAIVNLYWDTVSER